MSTTTPSGSQPGLNLLDSAGLTFPEIYNYAVENLGNEYVSASCKLFNQMSGVELRSGNMKVQTYRYGIKYPFAAITNRATSGSNLILTLAQAYSQFREGDIVRAKSEAQGRVVDTSTGIITIAPYGATSFVSTDFMEDETVGWQGNMQPRDGGNSVERLIFMPVPYYNVIEQQRETAYLAHDEAWQQTFIKDKNGNPYYLRTSQVDAMNRLMLSICKRLYTGVRIENTTANQAGGVIWQIKNQGGTYKPFYSSLQETELMDMFGEINKKGGIRENEMVALWGYAYSQMFGYNVGKQYITTAGDSNVVGGKEVHGLNVMNYGVGGFKLKGIRDWFMDAPGIFAEEGFSNVTNQRTRSGAAVFFDPSMCQTDGGMKPAVMNYYFGVAGMIRWEYSGGTNIAGGKASNPVNGKLLGTEEFHYNGMYQLTQPMRHGYHFLASAS